MAAFAIGLGLPLILAGAGRWSPAGAGFPYLAVLPFAAVLAVLWGLHDLRRKRDITITADEITFRDRGLFSLRSWREPLATYRGVTWRAARSARSDKGGAAYLVELTHEKRSRSLALWTLHDEAEARRRCEVIAETLGLPIIASSAIAKK